MSKLSKIFESIKATLHWGPSVEPFHVAVVEEHDALEARVAALEAQVAADKQMMDEARASHAAYQNLRDPDYITETTAEVPVEQAAAEALAGAPDDAASLVGEQTPAEPVQTPVSDLLVEAQPEPVSAGPADAIDALANGDEEKQEEPPQDPITE